MKTVAVIGLGSIGMRHAKNLRAMGHHVWGLDTDMSKRLDLGFDYTATKIEHLETADAFIIASPTPLHQQHILQCAGKPTFVEKPVTQSLPAVLASTLMVGYNLRFHSCVKKAKEWLDAGLIGTPLWSNFTLGQYNDRPAYLRDGVILNWSHEIDLCTYLLGPADVACSSTRLTDGKDDMTDILLTHKSGCRSSVHLDYLSDPESRHFFIHGAKGVIDANLVSRRANLYCATPTEPFRGEDNWNLNYIEEMQAFLDRCDGKETIGCTGAEGLEVLKICLEVRKQAELE